MTSAMEIVRKSGIGASEIPGVVKISPWLTPWIVYARKVGLIDPEPETPEMAWGKRLQTVIAQAFADKTGLEVEWCDRQIFSREHPWQFASPDAFIVSGERRVLEIKTAGVFAAGEWSRDRFDAEGVPEDYNAQIQQQLDVTGLKNACLAVLIGGNDFRIYWIEGDPVIQGYLREEGETFWYRHVLAGVPPPIDDSEAARRYLRHRYPREQEKLRPATLAEARLLDEYALARRESEAAERKRGQFEAELKNAIGDAEGLLWTGGRMTWKRSKDRQEVDWQGLAEERIAGLPEEEQKALRDAHMRTVEGSRRIHFAPAKEAA